MDAASRCACHALALCLLGVAEFSRPGTATLYWKNPDQTRFQSASRFYRAGLRHIQFAFAKDGPSVQIRLTAPGAVFTGGSLACL